MDSVDERSPSGGTFVRELLDRILNEVGGLRIGRRSPGASTPLEMETDLPTHALIGLAGDRGSTLGRPLIDRIKARSCII